MLVMYVALSIACQTKGLGHLFYIYSSGKSIAFTACLENGCKHKVSKDPITPIILRFPYHCSIFDEINRLSYNQNTRKQSRK